MTGEYDENLSPDQVEKELEDRNTLLVDIREDVELEEDGRIKGSVHIPLGQLEACADPKSTHHNPELIKDRRIILYCARGNRSAFALEMLKRMGFERPAHLEGGIKAWSDEGKVIVT